MLVATPPPSLFLDATYTHVRTTAQRQVIDGVLRDRAGRRIGRFNAACTRTALERCSASGRSARGTIRLAGRSRASELVHTWRVVRATGAWRGVRGRAAVVDVGGRESLIGVGLGAPADRGFIARADRACRRASAKLAALPPFAFAGFDPLHPDPRLLPQVGAFFTGPGDPRPVLRALDRRLRALGRPPAARATWRRLIAARAHALANIEAQDRAALAADAPAFVATVHESTRAFRHVALPGLLFGAVGCVS
ncbi:MAG TPA: hypothetical protein VH418_14770 [Solirubrobacteraceae bacterium]|jgi:hypothetical protein